MAKERRKDRPLAHRALASFYMQKSKNEIGFKTRPWGADIPVAVCYPNSYSIGMNNLGFFSLLNIINDSSGFIAERVFLEEKFNEEALSVESVRPLSDFAHLFFTVSYELDFFNIARLLKKSDVPLWAKERGDTHPIVFGGGACFCANPAPVLPFIDALCIGEADAILPNVLPILRENTDRNTTLQKLSRVDGIYVPSISQNPVRRVYTKDLQNPPYTSILSSESENGGAFMLEVSRSCPHSCSYCVAKSAFEPFRYYPLDNLLNTLKNRPSDAKVWLVGASVFSHPRLDELSSYFADNDIDFAISSLRARPLSPALLQNLRRGGNKTLSFAPETAASLRKSIGKSLADDDFVAAVKQSAESGFSEIKLYFMAGLPDEDDNTLQEIAELSLKCAEAAKPSRLSISVAPFVPKASTPMQNTRFAKTSELKKKISFLERTLQKHGIKVKAESVQESAIQALLSRGGTDLAPVIADAASASLSDIKTALAKHNISIEDYLHSLPPAPQESDIISGSIGL